jgi:hypothetical protein
VLLQSDQLVGGFVLLILLFVLAAFVALILVGVWLYRDTKQRGENTTLWLVLYAAFGLITGLLGAVVVVIIYLVSRSKEIKFDRYGNPLVPAYPSAPGYPAGMQWQPVPNAPPAYGTPSPTTFRSATPAPAWTPPTLSKVRCPRCRTVFEYERQPVGQTHVKCPACGEEGNI